MAGSITPIMEDYLKAIYELSEALAGASVSSSALVDRMAAPAPTVTDTIKRLAALGLVHHVPYRGVTLTPAGEKAALEVIRHHRLLEQYLAEALGLPWDQVHDEADRLEHVLSEALEARIAAALGHPTLDPHGDPIPTVDLTLVTGSRSRLSDLPVGGTGVVARVADQAPAKLRYLATLGLVPGAGVAIVARAPFDGPIEVIVGGEARTIAHELADMIFVEPNREATAPVGSDGTS